MQLLSQMHLFMPSLPDAVPLAMVIYQGLCCHNGPCAAQRILVVDLDEALFLRQVGLEAPQILSPSTPPTAEGKMDVDYVELEIAEQPPVVGLDDPVHLHHDAISRQLLRHHEWQPDLVVKGPRSEGEAHAVVWPVNGWTR